MALIEQQERRLFASIKSTKPQVSDEEIKNVVISIRRKILGFLDCPRHHRYVEVDTCRICPYGHIGECHFPYRCADPEANCEYQKIVMKQIQNGGK